MIQVKLFKVDSTEETEKKMNEFLEKENAEYVDSCAAGAAGFDTYMGGGTMVKGLSFLVVLFYRKKS